MAGTDGTLAEQLAAVMHTACDGPTCDCSQGARYEFGVCAAAALAWLAARGRLVPEGATVEWAYENGHGVTFPALSVEEVATAVSLGSGHGVRRIVGPWEPVPAQPDTQEATDA